MAPTVPYDTNIPDRGAFFLNAGRIFDPALVGYTEMQRVWRETLASRDDENAEGTAKAGVEVGTQVTPESQVEAESTGDEIPNAGGLSHWPGTWKLGMSPFKADTSASVPAQTSLPPGYVDLRIGGVGIVLDLGWHRTDEGLHWEVENVRRAAEAKRNRMAQHREPASPIPQPPPADNAWLRTPFVGFW